MNPMSLLRGWRLRDRELRLALCVLAALSLVFVAWPSLDLRISAWFVGEDGAFVGNRYLVVRWIYESVPWLGRAAALVGAVVAWRLWRRPGAMGVRWWRRSMVLALGMLLVVGLLVN
ncbi:MAG: hypothetical protein J0M20_17175, partial [Burkholderiales bacterium]|nr:hypothetical protein [Burkholderiales bacterium]